MAACPTVLVAPRTISVSSAVSREALAQRAEGSVIVLRDGGQREPVEVEVGLEHTGCRHHGIFGIAAVERSPHASHEGDDAVASLQGSVGGVNHLTGTLDAGDDGRVDIVAVGLIHAQDGFGVVQAGSVDADNHPSGSTLRYGYVCHP